nr:MAG TPA: hypothetical protein [Caudoviricetes sp.]
MVLNPKDGKLEKILIHNLLLLAINYNMVYTCSVSIHAKSALCH